MTGRLLRRLAPWHGALVVTHHRIGEAASAWGDPAVFSATQEGFDAQLTAIARHADLIAPEDLEGVRRRRGRCVLVTFDDGYRDLVTHALPVLQAHGVRAAAFLATGFMDRPHPAWWDELTWMAREAGVPERAPAWIARHKQLPAAVAERRVAALSARTGTGRAPEPLWREDWLTWDDVRTLRDAGMTLGGHTVTHPLLARLPEAAQAAEVEDGARRLAEETGRRPRWFAYPVGTPDAFDARTRRVVEAAGFDLAFSFYSGWNPWTRWDPFDVRRTWPEALRGPRLARAAALPGLAVRPCRAPASPPVTAV
jgi:peptidoglycan/xylan/chitin deacetylase (PgdA/CDA1 family)